MARQGKALELIGCPLDLGGPHRGSAAGPGALRAAGLAARLSAASWAVRDAGDVPAPAAVALGPEYARCHNAGAVAGWTRVLHDRAYQALVRGALPVFLGGDHSLSMGSVSGVARACADAGRPLAVLWIDAHADFNTPTTTETGNLHGMGLAFLTGEPELCALGGDRIFVPVRPAAVGLFGLRDVDAAERDALGRSAVQALSMAAWRERGIGAAVAAFLDRLDPDAHLHVSLDLDVVDPAEAPGVGTPVPGGATRAEARAAAAVLARSTRVGSLDLVELDPARDPSGASAALFADLAATLLGRS